MRLCLRSIKVTRSQISLITPSSPTPCLFGAGGHGRVVLLQQPKLWALLASQSGIFSLMAVLISRSSRATLCCLTEALSNVLFLFFDLSLCCPVFMLEVSPRVSEFSLSCTDLSELQQGQQLPSPLHSSVRHFYHYFRDVILLHTKHCKDPSYEEVPAAETLRMKKTQPDLGALWLQLATGNLQQGLQPAHCSDFSKGSPHTWFKCLYQITIALNVS